jgi:DNA-binding response OmpR family regulator
MAKKILIIDDDVAMCLSLSSFFKLKGYEAVTATDAYVGVTTAVAEKPAVIILDMQMPAGGGEGVFERLVANAATNMIPVIFATSLPVEDVDKLIPKHPNARAYFQKPPDLAELLDKVKVLAGEP